MNKKEFKETWSNKTLLEVKEEYNSTLEQMDKVRKSIKRKSMELAELDFENPRYTFLAKNIVDDLKLSTKWLKDLEPMVEILKPILNKKEQDKKSEGEINEYKSTNKDDLSKLYNEIDRIKEVLINKEPENEKIINNSIQVSTIEIIDMLQDTVGNIIECTLSGQGNRGFNGFIKGDKGSIEINTILAGGYNIQKLHLRTLVRRL